MLRLTVPHRVQLGEVDRPRIAGSITYTGAMPSHRSGVAHVASARPPYRPIRSTGSPYPIITDAICCELQSRQ
jgi:hypothetical protein